MRFYSNMTADILQYDHITGFGELSAGSVEFWEKNTRRNFESALRLVNAVLGIDNLSCIFCDNKYNSLKSLNDHYTKLHIDKITRFFINNIGTRSAEELETYLIWNNRSVLI